MSVASSNHFLRSPVRGQPEPEEPVGRGKEHAKEEEEDSMEADGDREEDEGEENDDEPEPDPQPIQRKHINLRDIINKGQPADAEDEDEEEEEPVPVPAPMPEPRREKPMKICKPAATRIMKSVLSYNKILERGKKKSPEREAAPRPEPAQERAALRNIPEPRAAIPTNIPSQQRKPKKGKLVGKSLTMCPPAEITERESLRDYSIFEVDPAGYHAGLAGKDKDYRPRLKPEWAIKKFIRSAADRKMDDENTIRPPEVLTATLNYLLDNIIDADKSEHSHYARSSGARYALSEIYIFLSDRTRSIRQDFNMQNVEMSKHYIQAFEKIARFHLLCTNHCLGLESFDEQQNSEQLTSTLTSLREAYLMVRCKLARLHVRHARNRP